MKQNGILTPRQIELGYRVSVAYGLVYVHQGERLVTMCTSDTIPRAVREAVRQDSFQQSLRQLNAGGNQLRLKEVNIKRDYALEEFFRVEIFGDKEVLVGLAEGPIPNETRVRKVGSLPGDGHQDGALGTVVGALGPANEEVKAELRRLGLSGVEWMYWVEWDDVPGAPVAITDNRIERV